MRFLQKVTLGLGLGLSIAAGVAGSAYASVVATQGYADIGTPEANGSPTGDINTATIFTIGDLVSTTSNTGSLTGLPTQGFGLVTFNATVGTSLAFGSAAFGDFTSTSINEFVNTAGVVSFYVLGDWTPGTYGGIAAGSYLSSFTITFNQTPAVSGSIADAATFSVPPATPVPETSTLVMLLVGFAAIGLIGGRAIKPAGAALA